MNRLYRWRDRYRTFKFWKPFDSGDIPSLSRAVRQIFDDAGLNQVKIFVSSGVDEYSIDAWLSAGVPIDAFGVGTHFITSADRPYLDMAYKLTEYEGLPKFKTSPGKATFPYKRQVVRFYDKDIMVRDETCRMDAACQGEKLVQLVMNDSKVIKSLPGVLDIRETFLQDIKRIPKTMRGLDKIAYDVQII